MAKVTIVLEDTEDGKLHIQGDFDPVLTSDDIENITEAQATAILFLEELISGSLGGEDDPDSVDGEGEG